MEGSELKELLSISDKDFVVNVLTFFIKSEIEKAGFKKAVIGISGGVDSALSAFLCVRALGKDNVVLISMPYKESSTQSVEDSRLIGKVLGANFFEMDISPQIDVYYRRYPNASKLRKGNKMARERMSILYDFAYDNNALVVGTSNKSELLIGYSTRWGDNAYDINPLGDLYKTQVWEIAKFLGVPEKIVKKKPSADLWPGQTDEGELGFPYDLLDRILVAYVDLKMRKEEILSFGFDKSVVHRILNMVRQSQYKRKLPIVCKIAQRTVDKDFLYLRDWGI